MSDCPYYRIHQKLIKSREVRADRLQDARVTRIPYCAHKHTPFPHRMAKTTIASADALACKGKLDACPLTSDQFDDQ